MEYQHGIKIWVTVLENHGKRLIQHGERRLHYIYMQFSFNRTEIDGKCPNWKIPMGHFVFTHVDQDLSVLHSGKIIERIAGEVVLQYLGRENGTKTFGKRRMWRSIKVSFRLTSILPKKQKEERRSELTIPFCLILNQPSLFFFFLHPACPARVLTLLHQGNWMRRPLKL